jgi:nucleoside-diphosphate-sugar epimerase
LRVPPADLDHILHFSGADLQELKGASLFMSGGTGFIGRWLLESLCHANRVLELDVSVTVLSRAPEKFRADFPHLGNDPAVRLIAGDIRNFTFPDGAFSHAVHAATDVVADIAPLDTFDVTVTGTRRFLDFCAERGVTQTLLLSSGAIYGRIPHHVDRVREDHDGAPDPALLSSAYGMGKLATEWLGTAFSSSGRMACKSARVFAQIGPYLALDKQFAAGNFVRDALAGTPIIIRGDGTPLRSYMYAADLAVWLWGILVRGKAGRAYNVGSDVAISIRDLAAAVGLAAGRPDLPVNILGKPVAGRPPERYVPAITRAEDELGLEILIPLDEAIRRTLTWYEPIFGEAAQ